jgi:hypothetical protein
VQADAYLQVFADVDGHQPEYNTLQWVSHSVDLLALAGQSFQFSVQCRRYSPAYAVQCWAEVDAFSVKCVHPSTPEFQVYLCKFGLGLSQNNIGSTTDLGFAVANLEPFTTYQWRVASVRDGITNLSAIASFKTGPSSAPKILPVQVTATGVTLQFESRADRYYAIEQSDTLAGMVSWYEIVPATPGTGATMALEAPLPASGEAYWRLRVSP